MIEHLHGTIASVRDATIVLVVQGVGFTVQVPTSTIYHPQQQVALTTYLHWNQEQGPSLYGFVTELERKLFMMIIDCSGIGPKIALAVLANLGPERFIAAVHGNNEKELSSVSGIGPKKAEQMLIQLRDKVAKLIKMDSSLATMSTPLIPWNEAAQVLESLNYSKPEIADALKYVRDTHGQGEYAFDQLVRHALSFLAKKTYTGTKN
jgi:Holliday junction DNA helicase RuvA